VNYILFGPPGAGKGTHASKLVDMLKLAHISTGDIFRAEVKLGSPLGKKVSDYLNRGELVPDEVVNEVLKKWINKTDNTQGFILDGYPRTIEQAKALEKVAQIDAIVQLAVPDWVIVERLSNRRICKNCGAIYNIKYFPKPKVDSKCDKCGAEIYQREDDNPEVITDRLKVYEKQTQPLIDYYKTRGVTFVTAESKKVDEPIEVVFQKILDGMKKAKLI
jgi:adenylate kinase